MANLEIELKSPSFSNTKMVPRLGTRSANSMTCYNRYPTLSKFPFLNLRKPVSFHVLSPLALLSPQFTPHSAVSLSLSLSLCCPTLTLFTFPFYPPTTLTFLSKPLHFSQNTLLIAPPKSLKLRSVSVTYNNVRGH